MIQDYEHSRFAEFAGRPICHVPKVRHDRNRREPLTEQDWLPVPEDVENWAWRVGSVDYYGPEYLTAFAWFLENVDTTRVRAFVIGNWATDKSRDEAEKCVRALADAADRFPALEAVFVADVGQQENEISWINQTDLTPLLTAFPDLRILGARGGNGLGFGPLQHAALRELTFQSGGLPPEVVRGIGASDLPALTDLELYLGTDEYGGGADAEDLAPILSGERLPSLRYLGLRDAENIDELVAAVAHAPIVAQLEVLDLSLGNLSDEGAATLLAGQPLTHLKKLDLHHHYLSDEMMERIQEALPGVEVDVNSQLEGEDEDDGTVWRYIAVDE